jgi:TolB-like protein
VEAGQILGVEYIFYGSIGRIGNVYTINTYLTNVERGQIVASGTVDHRGSIEDLLTEGMATAASRLLMNSLTIPMTIGSEN